METKNTTPNSPAPVDNPTATEPNATQSPDTPAQKRAAQLISEHAAPAQIVARLGANTARVSFGRRNRYMDRSAIVEFHIKEPARRIAQHFSTDPTETKPTETKPTETKPTETKPAPELAAPILAQAPALIAELFAPLPEITQTETKDSRVISVTISFGHVTDKAGKRTEIASAPVYCVAARDTVNTYEFHNIRMTVSYTAEKIVLRAVDMNSPKLAPLPVPTLENANTAKDTLRQVDRNRKTSQADARIADLIASMQAARDAGDETRAIETAALALAAYADLTAARPSTMSSIQRVINFVQKNRK